MMVRYRAWQFVHPDYDRTREQPGLHVSAQGRIGMVEDADAIRQAILLLLSTAPGERVMRPDYGCELSELMFSPNDDATAGLAIHYVRRALERWEPRIEILELDASSSPERPERLDIVLRYRIRATQQVDQVGYAVHLAGEEV
ncbi:MAG: GPW/gp25 family protein [Anaerolineae bacterium]|jgi:uncharacterized protein